MLFRILLCVLGLALVQAGTTTMKPHHTHKPHATSEPSERDNLRFIYEAHSHQMIVTNAHNCYIFTLSDSERTAVHTDIGIRTLELKLLNLLSSGTQTQVTLTDQPKSIQHACGHGIKGTYTVM